MNLAAVLGGMGKKVLVVDMDPQGNCTSGLGVDREQTERSVYQLLMDSADLPEVVVETEWTNVSVIPANIDLAGSEVELAGVMSRETRLRRKLREGSDYDVLLIDCPPSLGLLTINALVASEHMLVPIQCEYYALEGVGQLLRTVRLIQGYLNEDLAMDGIVLTMFDGRTNLSREVADEVRRQFGEKVFETIIPRNVRLSEAPSYGKPIGYYAANSVGARAFQSLGQEVVGRWLKAKR